MDYTQLSPNELNAELASKLFGMEVHIGATAYPSGYGNVEEVHTYFVRDMEDHIELPDYLTWQGMGEVIEAMAKRGWEVQLYFAVEYAEAWLSRYPEKGFGVANDKVAPRAVAIAALSAFSQEVEA